MKGADKHVDAPRTGKSDPALQSSGGLCVAGSGSIPAAPARKHRKFHSHKPSQCCKTGYSRAAAALRTGVFKNGKGRKFSYFCGRCGMWHLETTNL